jgi:hypothetical protein
MKVKITAVTNADINNGFYLGDIKEVVINENGDYEYSNGHVLYSWQVRVIQEQTDSILESVINQFRERSEVGIKKYGVTLDITDLSSLDWINHAQQEAMDFVLYLEKLKQMIQ